MFRPMQLGTNLTYRKFLLDELHRRQKKNPAYSSRAFARDIGVNSSRLSEILSGKVGLSETRAIAISDRLQMSDDIKALFIDLVICEDARSGITRAAAKSRIEARMLHLQQLEDQDFSLISSWHYLAILELIQLDGLEHSADAFAKKLSLPLAQVQEGLERLQRLGHIKYSNARWIPSEPDSTTTSEVASESIRAYHRQILEKASSALETPVEKRDFSSMIFSLNSEQLTYAKERLQDFRRSLVKELEGMPGKDSVYCLSFQLFEAAGDLKNDL